jgi:hypothetical protein
VRYRQRWDYEERGRNERTRHPEGESCLHVGFPFLSLERS